MDAYEILSLAYGGTLIVIAFILFYLAWKR